MSEKNTFLESIFFCKTRTDYAYKPRVQDFATVRISLSITVLNKRESYFIKAIENFFPVFAYPDINTRGVGKILDNYANPRLRLGFVYLFRILLTPLVFLSGYANTGNVFYCLIGR